MQSFIALGLVAAILTGCTKSQPTCIDDATISLVKQAVDESLEKQLSDGAKDDALFARVKKRIQVAITTIRTSKKDDKIGKVSCDASLEITIANPEQITGDPSFKALQNAKQIPDALHTSGPAWKTDIQYTAQNTEDTRDLLVELSGHDNMVRLLSAVAKAGLMDPKQSPAVFPVDLFAAANARDAAVRLMTHVYGKQEAKHGCWMTTVEDSPYCLKLVQAEIKALDTGRRLYAVANGQVVDQNGEPLLSHATPGFVSAFIVGETNGKAALIARSKSIEAGTMGSAPEDWKLTELGANNNWGWRGEYGDCHQGYCGSRMVILANIGGVVVDVGTVTTGYDDTGACGDDACGAKTSTVKSTVSVGALPKGAAFYNLLVTVTGTSDGKVLESKTWTLPFNSAEHAYTEPADWPLGDRDF